MDDEYTCVRPCLCAVAPVVILVFFPFLHIKCAVVVDGVCACV